MAGCEGVLRFQEAAVLVAWKFASALTVGKAREIERQSVQRGRKSLPCVTTVVTQCAGTLAPRPRLRPELLPEENQSTGIVSLAALYTQARAQGGMGASAKGWRARADSTACFALGRLRSVKPSSSTTTEQQQGRKDRAGAYMKPST